MDESPELRSHTSVTGRSTPRTGKCQIPIRSFSSLKLDKDDDDEDSFFLDWTEDAEADDNDKPHGLSSLLNSSLTPVAGGRRRSDVSGSFGSLASTTPDKEAETGTIGQQVGQESGRSSGHVKKYRTTDFSPTSGQEKGASPFTITIASCLKRCNSPVDHSPMIFKRRRTKDVENESSPYGVEKRLKGSSGSEPRVPLRPLTFLTNTDGSTPTARASVPRSHSESQVAIMKAVSQSAQDQTLIGDFTKPYVLPLISGGRHPDLKAINGDTMAKVLGGEFSNWLASHTILDCRYPYEYEGGHIRNAINWPRLEMVMEFLSQKTEAPPRLSETTPRNILIFYCEFSAERAPRALRRLREVDRTTNKDYYPALHFPEVYLLEGGYKAFYGKHPELCIPPNYTCMLDPRHTEDLKDIRAKSRSWGAESKHTKYGQGGANRKTGLGRFVRHQSLYHNSGQ
ncbi:M-phase inducer phosphatase-like [Oratosquilla oratoria]|uniref:M-phase inducer phosphatase-like n=1 Tax=Oratosquilla oratoria TaxID=337810 RepID=UPI003F762AA5